MIDQRLGGRLRRLPGVLDCSVIDGGVALLVHPEVDIRVLKARAQAVMYELGDERPLLLIGGMGSGSAGGEDRSASPFRLGAFAVAVLCLLALMPTAAPPRPRPAFSGPLASASADTLTPELARPRMLSAVGRRGSSGSASSAGPAAVVTPADVSGGPDSVLPAAPAEAHRRGARRGQARVPHGPAAPPPRPPATPPAVDAVSVVRLPQISAVELWRGPGQSGPHRHGPK